MCTTLDIEDDVLEAAKELARRQGASTGQVVSRLLRAALHGRSVMGLPPRRVTGTPRGGWISTVSGHGRSPGDQ
jgi:hypothetical protein